MTATENARDNARTTASLSAEDRAERAQGRWFRGDTDAKVPSSTRHKLTTIIMVLAALIMAAAGIVYFISERGYVSTDDAFVDGRIVLIAAQQPGLLVEIAAEPNARVVAGDLLARIDAASATASLALAKGQQAEAAAAVDEANAALAQANASAQGARSEADLARVTAEDARSKATRLSKLADKTGKLAVSAEALEDALAAAREAEAAEAAADTDVAAADSLITAREASVTAAKAATIVAKADVQQAEIILSQLAITAPIDGQVVQVNVNIGSYVSPGMQIMALVPDDLFITANFKETQLARIRPGQKVDISVDAFPDVPFKGTVQSIQRGAGQAFQLLPPENATGNFVKVVQRVPVRISIDSPSMADYPLGPGMSVVPSVRVGD